MLTRVSTVFYFGDDLSLRRSINECLSIIQLYEVTDENEISAVNALMNGFTREQFELVKKVAQREATNKMNRHVNIDTEFSRAVVAQTKQAYERFVETCEAIERNISLGQVIRHTGMKKPKESPSP